MDKIKLCNFVKEYDEPKEKYNIFSFSIFYMNKYIRHHKNYSKDISIKRQIQFLYNLVLNINNLNNGYFGDDWYFRIFYDNSLFKFSIGNKKPWKSFHDQYKEHPRIQFVRYECPYFLDKLTDTHLNLFGTLIRLYPIFEKNDKLGMVCIFDADNFITKKYFDEIKEFEKSTYDYNSFCSSYEISSYINYDANDPDNCYLRCGMLSIKKKLPEHYWNYILYQLKDYDDKNFNKLIDGLYKNCCKLSPEKKIKTYKEFEYGMDEIVLNFYIKKMFMYHKYKMRVVRYQSNKMSIINILILHLNLYYENNKNNIDTFLKNMIKSKYVGDIKKDLNSFNVMFYTQLKSSNFNILMAELKNNYYLIEKIKIPRTIVRYIKDYANNMENNITQFNEYFVSLDKPIFL